MTGGMTGVAAPMGGTSRPRAGLVVRNGAGTQASHTCTGTLMVGGGVGDGFGPTGVAAAMVARRAGLGAVGPDPPRPARHRLAGPAAAPGRPARPELVGGRQRRLGGSGGDRGHGRG